VADGKNKFIVEEFFKLSIPWLKHGLILLNPTTMDGEKSYAVISFKIFNALCREKK
jgi:hypothetical protein